MWIEHLHELTKRLDALDRKFDKVIEVLERPYEAERIRLQEEKRKIVHMAITDLIDPSHYHSIKTSNEQND